jgi:transposase-like protein
MWEDRPRDRSAKFQAAMKTPRAKQPESLPQFATTFSDDAKCREYLFKTRWPEGFACPKCSDTKAYVISTRNLVECKNGHQTSLTAGTALHHTLQPLHKWFWAAWLLATLKPGMSSVQFQRQMGFPWNEAAFVMLHKLRSTMVAPERRKLTSKCGFPGHSNHWVEIDEVYVGGQEEGKEHRGRGSDSKVLVGVAVEVHEWEDENRPGVFHTKAGRSRIHILPDMTHAALMAFVTEVVEPGSRLFTDAASGYQKAHLHGFPQHVVTMAKFDPDPLPTIGRVVTNLKRWWIGTHKGAIQPQHLQTYLNEFVFRFNNREDTWGTFNKLLGLAVLARPRPTRTGLYKHTWPHRKNPSRTHKPS